MTLNLAAIFDSETAVATCGRTTVSVPMAAIETDAEVEVVAPHIDPEPVPFDPFDRPDPNLRGLCQPPIHPQDPDRLKRVLTTCDKCGSTEYVDVDIHGNYSLRRDCARCGRFLGWPKWRGLDLADARETRAERCERILKPASALMFSEATACEADAIAKGFETRQKALAD